MDNAIAGPSYVVTLVHGTFAPDAEWTHPGSVLRRTIERHLGGPTAVQFEVFQWRGFLGSKFNNGHRYRLRAAHNLSSRLKQVLRDYPGARHFLVAHSHGGNVALYALRAPELNDHIAGVVCLATPFISCEAKDLRSLTSFYPMILWTLLAFTVLLPLGLKGVDPAMDGLMFLIKRLPSLASPMIWLAALGASIALYLCFAKLPTRLIDGVAIPWLEKWVPRQQQKIVSRLSLPVLADTPVLCMRAAGDEARRHLLMVKGAGDVPYWLWRGSLYMALFLLITGVAFLFPGSSPFYVGYFPLWMPPDSAALIERLRSAGATAGVIVMLASALHFVTVAVAPWLIRGHWFGFGQESILDNLLANIGVAADYPGPQTVNRQYALHHPGLRHSGLYQDDEVLTDIATWVAAKGASWQSQNWRHPS